MVGNVDFNTDRRADLPLDDPRYEPFVGHYKFHLRSQLLDLGNKLGIQVGCHTLPGNTNSVYRGTSLKTCGDSENACLFLKQTRNFPKDACFVHKQMRNFPKRGAFFICWFSLLPLCDVVSDQKPK